MATFTHVALRATGQRFPGTVPGPARHQTVIGHALPHAAHGVLPASMGLGRFTRLDNQTTQHHAHARIAPQLHAFRHRMG